MAGLLDDRVGAAWRGVEKADTFEKPLALLGAASTAALEPVAHILGTRAESKIQAPELPALGPKITPVLTWLYGENQEHWEESPSSMIQSPDGQQRFLGWKNLIQNDPAFQERRKQLAGMYPNEAQGESYWNHAILEYKQARKRDAETNRSELGANVGLNIAFSVFPAMKVFQGARAAGAGRMLAAQTAITSEVMAPVELGKALLKAPGQLLKRPRLIGAPVAGAGIGYALDGEEGAAKGAVAGALLGAGSGLRSIVGEARGLPATPLDRLGAWMRETKDLVPGPALKLEDLGWGLGKIRPTITNLAEATGSSPTLGMSPAMSSAALGALYGGLTEGTQGAAIGALLGGVAGRAAPSGHPGAVLGALGGGLVGAQVNEDDPWMGAAVGALGGAALGAGAQKGLNPANLRKLVYAEGGQGGPKDIRGWARFMGNLIPEADWRRVELFAKHLYPILDEQDKLLDAARTQMRTDMVEAVGGARVLQDEAEMAKIHSALEGLGRGGRIATPRVFDETTHIPTPAEVQQSKRMEAGVKAYERLVQQDSEAAGRAVAVRKVLDKWFDDAVEGGLVTKEQYVEGYIPRVLDEVRFWKSAPATIKSRESMRGLDHGLRKVFQAVDSYTQEQEAALGAGYGKLPLARDSFLEDPEGFVKSLRDGLMGLTKEEATQLIGGEHRWAQIADVQALAKQYTVSPATVIKILRGPAKATSGEDAGIMFGGKIKGDWIPEALANEFGLARTGGDLPVLKHFPTVIDRYIDRTTRRRYYDPLLREWNSMEDVGTYVYRGAEPRMAVDRASVQGKSFTPIPGRLAAPGAADEALLPFHLSPTLDMVPTPPQHMEARLKPLHDALRGENMPHLSKIAQRLVNSRLGVPSQLDVLVEDSLFSMMRANPARYREAARFVLDMQYTGALGFKPASAVRNLFQSMLTATALGPGHFAMGMREVARREKSLTELAKKYGALRDPMAEAFDVAKISGSSPMRRTWNNYVAAAFDMFHAADQRNRLWAFAGGQRRALLELEEIKKVGMSHPALAPFRESQRRQFAALANTVSRDEFAGRYGAALSDLTQWVYGKRGSPLAVRNTVGANLGIFTTWPANYLSLLYEWASNGQIGKIVNLSLGAAILDRIGAEAGVGRLTGFTSGEEGPASVLPVGPIPSDLPGLGSPAMKLAGELGTLGVQAGKAAMTGGEEGDFSPYRYHSLLLPVQPAQRLVEAGLADDPEVTMRRLTGSPQPKERR